MQNPAPSFEGSNDPDFFINVQDRIEKELSKMKKITNSMIQMRVEAAYLESDIMMAIDSSTWENISELIGLTSMKIINIHVKND